MGLLQEEHEKSIFYNFISYRRYTESQFFCKISILLFDLFLIGTLEIITLAYLLKIAQRGEKSGILLFSAFSNLKAAVSADFGRPRSKSTSVVPWGQSEPTQSSVFRRKQGFLFYSLASRNTNRVDVRSGLKHAITFFLHCFSVFPSLQLGPHIK